MKFNFKIDTRSLEDDDADKFNFVDAEGTYSSQGISLELGQVNISVSISPNKEKTYISDFSMEIPQHRASISMSANAKGGVSRLSINGEDPLSQFQNVNLRISNNSIFPEIGFVIDIGPEQKSGERFVSPLRRLFADAIFKILRDLLDQRTKDQTVRLYAESLLKFGVPGSPTFAGPLRRSAQQTFKVFVEDLLGNRATKEAKAITTIVWLYLLPRVVREISNVLDLIMRSVLYIGPARARSDRYYRNQDLSVSEIDPDGKNFPMFLSSLTSSQVESLSAWMQKLYGFGVGVEKSGGHISIFQREGQHKTNVVDAGYGISQILPVLGQLWWAQNRRFSFAQRRASQMSIIAIEQPELHLHPAHQALLADALVDLIKPSFTPRIRQRDNRFIIETHSETFINRLGELVYNEKLDPSAIQILLFEPTDEDLRSTRIRTVSFDKKGSLKNWPFGFFLPETSC